jgi:hypothetical protein
MRRVTGAVKGCQSTSGPWRSYYNNRPTPHFLQTSYSMWLVYACSDSLEYFSQSVIHYANTIFNIFLSYSVRHWMSLYSLLGSLLPTGLTDLCNFMAVCNILNKGRAMAQVVSRWPLTAEARVRPRVNPCRICGRQSGTGTGYSPSFRFYPVSIYHSIVTLHTRIVWGMRNMLT